MPVTVERIPNEPILVATLTGHIGVEEMNEMFRLSAALADEMEGTIYRITDATHADSDLIEMLGVLRAAAQHIPGSTSDPRFRPVLVGRNAWTQFGSVNMAHERFGNVKLPIFLSLEDALNYVHITLDEQHNRTESE